MTGQELKAGVMNGIETAAFVAAQWVLLVGLAAVA